MADILFAALTVVFFTVSVVYLAGCGRL